ncbi:hypothetical protein [Trujillonella humicola]|uniref:hypothetical protein n=1 Tax=Trujillonella humicola TaxID=3383699 RepID=UPI00390682A8
MPGGRRPLTGAQLRTPRAAAVAGIVFSLLLGAALTLVALASPDEPATVGSWLTESPRRTALVVALALVPFAGIAFLWFIGVVRDRLGEREDRFFASVFLGSGLLFVAMLFAAAAVAGALVADETLRSGEPPGPTVLALGRRVVGLLLQEYAMRMAAVFTLSTATIALRTRVAARWVGLLGVVVALVLLLAVGRTPWVELLFPGWVLLLSVDILRRGPTTASGPGRATSSGPAAGGPPSRPPRVDPTSGSRLRTGRRRRGTSPAPRRSRPGSG